MPLKEWLASAGPYRIETIPCPHGTLRVDLGRPAAGVVHTTEGSFDSALAVFKQHYAPQFLVGPHRIAQLVPLGVAASALENHPGGADTNAWALVQIEVAGFSRTTPYTFGKATDDALAALMLELRREAGIPLARPFPDAMPPLPWSTESFPRRSAGKWGATAGWFGHVEIPENSHWDPGALQWSKILTRARDLDELTPKRLAVLRAWILTKVALGWPWSKIKQTANWREYRGLGGT